VVTSFAPTATSISIKPDTSLWSTSAETSVDENLTTSSGKLKRDRYIASNRFTVRKNKGPKFEARWANRKSSLAELQGFKYFHLMRRVTINEDGTNSYDGGDKRDGSNFANYVSFTIWDQKSNFNAWRKGNAFKEAHGGTSIGAFMKTMVGSALVLKGAPRPAFYDGLLVQSSKIEEEDLPETVDGWRNVEADGKVSLPEECFIAENQFFVSNDNAVAFERRWADRESKLKECNGFVAFSMMRRDANGKGHGVIPMTDDEPSYLSTTIWKDRASFDGWRKGNAFKKAHEGAKAPSNAIPSMPLWSKPPQPLFYEGTLVISNSDGA